jgi:hypothetical protein
MERRTIPDNQQTLVSQLLQVAKEVDAVQTVQRPLPDDPIAGWAIAPEDLTGERLPARLQVCQQYFGECDQHFHDIHSYGCPGRRPWPATFALCGSSAVEITRIVRKGQRAYDAARRLACMITCVRLQLRFGRVDLWTMCYKHVQRSPE